MSLICAPLCTLVAQEPLKDVIAKRVSDKARVFHHVQRFVERLWQLMDTHLLENIVVHLKQVGIGFNWQFVALLNAAQACSQNDREREVRVARWVW